MYLFFFVYFHFTVLQIPNPRNIGILLILNAMPTNQELNQLRKTLTNALGTINNTLNDEDMDMETVAEVGDIVEIVVNPGTPEEEIIEGELVGVLDEMDEDIVDDDESSDLCRTVLVRTKNGRVRQAKLAKSVKIRNSRKQNTMTVKTANGKTGNRNTDEPGTGLSAMRKGDVYKPPIDEGLKITKNTRTQNDDDDYDFDDDDDYDLYAMIGRVDADLYKALSNNSDISITKHDEISDSVDEFECKIRMDDGEFVSVEIIPGCDVNAFIIDCYFTYASHKSEHAVICDFDEMTDEMIEPVLKNMPAYVRKIVQKAKAYYSTTKNKSTKNQHRTQDKVINATVEEKPRNIIDEDGKLQKNSRYKRIKNYREVLNGDGSYDILIEAEEVEISPSCDESGIAPATVVEVVENGRVVSKTQNTREVATNNASADTMLNAMLAVANLSTMPLVTSAMMSCPEPVQEEYDMIPPKVTFGEN